MDQVWVCKVNFLTVVTFICLNWSCGGDDSCGYDVVGYVKNAIDSTSVPAVKIVELHFNLGNKKVGQDSISHTFQTDLNGKFSYEGWLTPQGAYECPTASEFELRFRYKKDGFITVDTVFAKGAILDEGKGERNKTI